jgi:hypothetical protein
LRELPPSSRSVRWTAKARDIALSTALLATADEVIE